MKEVTQRPDGESDGSVDSRHRQIVSSVAKNEMPIRVVLADDHALVRQGLKALLEREGFQRVGEASDGQEAVRVVPSL
jgi:PleD family two-component response regulator